MGLRLAVVIWLPACCSVCCSVRCSVLQYSCSVGVVCCSLLQCVAVYWGNILGGGVAACVLQCVLQFVAV